MQILICNKKEIKFPTKHILLQCTYFHDNKNNQTNDNEMITNFQQIQLKLMQFQKKHSNDIINAI